MLLFDCYNIPDKLKKEYKNHNLIKFQGGSVCVWGGVSIKVYPSLEYLNLA